MGECGREWRDELLAVAHRLPGRVSLTLEACPPAGGEGGLAFALAPEETYPAASLIKLPILLAVLSLAGQGEVDLTARVAVGGEGTGGAGVIEHLTPGTLLTVADLLFFMIAVSDNAATNHVLDLVGFAAINDWMARFGLAGTTLRRKMMDVEARRAGRENLTTPADQHRLLREIACPTQLLPAVAARARALLAHQQFKLGFAAFLPDERVAHKTGDLEGIFHDVGLVDPEGPVPLVYTFLSETGLDLGEVSLAAGRAGELAAGWLACWRAGRR